MRLQDIRFVEKIAQNQSMVFKRESEKESRKRRIAETREKAGEMRLSLKYLTPVSYPESGQNPKHPRPFPARHEMR